MYERTLNTINLKTDTANIDNIYDNLIHYTKHKNNFTNNSNIQTDNSNNFSTPATWNLNTFTRSVSKSISKPSCLKTNPQPFQHHITHPA